jgi:penicillin amidase/acyl-homoserine-lactone acylase
MAFLKLALSVTALACLASCATARPPEMAEGAFKPERARSIAASYNARIIRDKFGVPHIYGKTNADTSFGLAYAHAEDDWKNIEEVVRSSRGTLAEILGDSGAKSDNFILSLGITEIVNRGYAAKTSAKAKAIAEAYAAGLNVWCADHPETGCARTAPVFGRDIIAGYATRPVSFYGLDGEIDALVSGRAELEMSTKSTRESLLNITDDIELGSNALAVAPSRSADRHTRLDANPHQPFEGRVTFYEARMKSEEGMDVIGGLFPGTPLLLVGAGPKLGWTATVNKPDLYDTFKLVVDDDKSPTKYRMDGKWKDLVLKPIRYNVLRNGALAPVERTARWSEHGPVFVTEKGVFAVSFVGANEFRHLDQYLAMNVAKTVEEWRAAQIKYNAIPSVNYVVADSGGHIAFFWNARMPKRVEGWDRHKILPGDVSDTLWKGWEPVQALPSVINPKSGYVVSANHSPLLTSGTEDNPRAADYPASFGLDTLVTNRGLRAQELFSADKSITREEFLAYKMDITYSTRSQVRRMVASLAAESSGKVDAETQKLIDLIVSWDGKADMENRAAALAIFTGQAAMGSQIHDPYDHDKALAALKSTAALLKEATGRIDPKWSEVSRVARGSKSWATDGGPDLLRAIYAAGILKPQGFRSARNGDGYYIIADWAPDGTYTLDTIHQYGSATLDAASPHYDDQSPLFAAKQFKRPPMTLEGVLAEATRDYRPGR